ncbi:MAG: GreA/GreB family elongation factor [Erysipelotrichia bacterium]|nr:GreA/GreB family elongation factor [Erysipelotrichia bacterium]
MEENKVALTIEGLKKLENDYIRLLHIERYQNIEELKAARAQGDLSENADYDAARDQQGRIEATIKQYDYMLSNLELIDAKETKSKDKLQEELDNLKEERIVKTEAITEAKKDGLGKENEALNEAVDGLAQVETRIKIIEYLLSKTTETTKSRGRKAVKLGSTVTILTLDENELETYTIVGTVEADPLNGKISNESPLANALMDRKIDDVVTVMVQHPYKVKIKEIN